MRAAVAVILMASVLWSIEASPERVFKLKDRLSGCGPERCHPTVPGLINVHLVPHSHDDAGWLKTVDQYYYGDRQEIQRAGVQYILESVVKELAMDPAKKYIQVETGFLWRWWMDKDEFMRNLTLTLVNSGQLEFAGGGWSMNDEAATHFSSIIDNMELGLMWLRDNLGECALPRVAWQIDPFGHSKEQARLFAEMGFDGLFFARIDYKDKEERKATKQLQMVWEGGDPGDRAQSIFTGVFDTHYSAPQGFCWDILCTDEPINDDIRLEEYNLEETIRKFVDYVHQHIPFYKNGEHIMFTMGDDFHYQNARMNFKNMDKLIKHMNSRSNETGIHLLYSTPACYIDQLMQGEEVYPVKSDDFFPYASDPGVFWTGYFTSRPSIKLQERLGARDLAVCKQLEVVGPRAKTDSTFNLQRAMGLMQHHDAITGTEKQHVAQDYAKRLFKATSGCQDQNIQVLSSALGLEDALPDLTESMCPSLNISACRVSEQSNQFIVIVYNPLSHVVSPYIRIPVPDTGYSVHLRDGTALYLQINEIPEHVRQLPGRNSTAIYELIFKLNDVPALGATAVYVTKNNKIKPKVSYVVEDVTGELRGVSKERRGVADVQIGLQYYQGSADSSSRRNSGAYVFSPDATGKHPLGEEKLGFISGDLVNETILRYGDWGVLTTRQYLEMDGTEIVWQVGPIPVDDGIGKEVVLEYNSTLTTSGIFYTDANGRQMMERLRQPARTVKDIFQPSNYYPITSRIELRQDSDKKVMSVLTDRSEGGSSLAEGQLELMLHRRLLRDDSFGVGEALNETEHGTGLVAVGRHLLLTDHSLAQARIRMTETVSPVQISMVETPWTLENWQAASVQDFSALANELPPSIQVLSMSMVSDEKVLLRFQHIMDRVEDEEPVVISLQGLFTYFEVVSLTEMTLGGDRPLASIHKPHTWRTPAHQPLTSIPRAELEADLLVDLLPQQIRTFVAKVQWI